MTTFALAHITHSTVNDDIVEYLGRIDATLAPYAGRFRVHGGAIKPLEGAWTGQLVLIEFPDTASAEGWYGSAAYQDIIALRTANASADVILVEGVAPGYQAAEALAGLMAGRATENKKEH